jgi:hypothetical protein
MERIGMNERILELYKQAQVPDTAIDPSNNMPYETTRFSADKFAELIVRECMTVARGADGLDATHEAWYLIKEHFGVEE